MFELLANNAEFFIARRSPKSEILALAFVLVVVVPLLVGGLAALSSRMGMVLAGIAAASFAYMAVRRLPLPDWMSLLISAALAAGFVLAFWRYRPPRRAAMLLTLAPLVVLLFFLFATPAGSVVRDSGSTPGGPVAVARPHPVVLVVFDEFPVASIIDSEGNLRAERFPNLAALAADGIFFPNAVTVQQQTEHSLPAILTGVNPSQSLTPFAGQYPNSLFTALQGTYELHVYETITQLCPATLCSNTGVSNTPLARDVGVIAAHLLLPEMMARRLPPIDSSWGDFQAAVSEFDATSEFLGAMDDRIDQIDSFVLALERADLGQPSLFFLHTLLPHHPWEFFPDGTSYPLLGVRTPGTHQGGWIDDEFLAAQGMQRHLLQVGYVDRLIGLMTAAMKRSGIYENSIVVVVADHGISIKPGVEHQRKITPDTVGEIAAVPLFVKPPAQTGGVVDERRALTTDILPTITEVIGAEIPWNMDGSSLQADPPLRTETTTVGPERTVTFGVDGLEKLDTAVRIERWFPDGDPWALIPPGSPDLLGTRVEPASFPTAPGLSVGFFKPGLFENVNTARPWIPSRVGGRLGGRVAGDETLALVVNGEIAAMTRCYRREDEVQFMALIPPEAFVDGENRIEVLMVGDDGSLSLVPAD